MFDDSYPYHKKGSVKCTKPNDLLVEHSYAFSDGIDRYIVKVEEYTGCIFVPKFYAYADRDSPNRYYHLLNNKYPPKIIRTCTNITLEFLKIYPNASFGLIATRIIQGDFKEDLFNNSRFRVYRRFITNTFGEKEYFHLIDETHSAYLLMNKRVQDFEGAARKAVAMFIENYPDLQEEHE
jgi:hypothetical protein